MLSRRNAIVSMRRKYKIIHFRNESHVSIRGTAQHPSLVAPPNGDGSILTARAVTIKTTHAVPRETDGSRICVVCKNDKTRLNPRQ